MSIADLPTLAGPIDDELVDHELIALLGEATERQYATERSVEGLLPAVERLSPNTGTVTLGEGSEPELREDEVICEVTNLTYYKGLSRSPYLDERGGRIF